MEEINFGEVFSYFKTKILWILITIGVILALGDVFTVVIKKPMYKSNTTVVLISEKGNNYSQNDAQLNKNLIGTYSEIVKSRKVLDEVIGNLGLDYNTADLSNKINVSSVENTEIIKISVSDNDAVRAKLITDEIAKVFSEKIKEVYNLENVSVLDKAVVSKKPYNINFIKDSVIYLAIGFVLSFGIVFVMYYFDTTIKSSSSIEDKLGLTILGIVPKEEKE